MSSVSNANLGEIFPLLNLPMNGDGPLERVFGYVGPKELALLSSVSKLINSLVSDAGPDSMGGRLWRGLSDSQWTGYLKQRENCMVIDQNLWRTNPVLSQFLNANGLEVPPGCLGLDWRNDVLRGIKAVNSLPIENNAGTTYIVMPKGVTFRMLSDLLAKALGKATCFESFTQSFPPTYWDVSVEKAYAFVITNSVIENSRGASLQSPKHLLRESHGEMPEGIEQLSLLALAYIVTPDADRLYNDNMSTFGCTRINDLFFEIGGFSPRGIDVHSIFGDVILGLGALRKFRPL